MTAIEQFYQNPILGILVILALIVPVSFILIPILCTVIIAFFPAYHILKNKTWGWWRAILVPVLILLAILWLIVALDSA